MSEISKQALTVDNNISFPNNNAGAITPAILRAFNTNMIDSLVDEISYQADSSSWNSQIAAISASAVSTGSLMKTGSVSGNVLTFTKGDSTTFSLTVATGSGTSTDLTSLNAFTASQLTINSGYNTFTSSTNTAISNLNTTTASLNSSVSQLNANTASQQSQINSLISATASYANSASVASVDAAQQAQINSLIAATGSYSTSSVSLTSLNAYTQSNDTKWSNLGGQSGSWITESETASFARTNVDNNFTANQTFTNITAVSASFTYVQTLYETSSVIYSSGSNQFGDELSDIQTLSGSVKVQGSLTVNGTTVLTSSVDISGLVTTASFNAYTQSNDQKVNSLINATASYATSAITASSLVTASFSGNTLTFTKGDASTFGVVIPDVSGSTINTGSFATTGSNTFYGNQIISGNVFPQVDGQGDIGSDTFKWNQVVVNGQLKGSSLNTSGRGRTGTLGFADESFPLSFLDSREIIGDGSGANTHMYYATSSTDVNGLREFVYAQSGSDANFTSVSASFDTRINAITGSGGTINTGSFAITGSNTFIGTQIISGAMFVYDSGSDQKAEIMNGQISRFPQLYATSLFPGTIQDDNGNNILIKSNAGGAYNGGFLVVDTISGSQFTGSVAVQGDVNITGQYLINGVPISGGANINTGSFATTGSNTFVGNQIIATGNFQMPNGFSITAASGDVTNLSAGTTIQFITEPPAGPGGTNDIKFINRVTGSSIEFNNQIGGAGNPINFIGGAAGFTLNAVSGSTGKLNINAQGGIDATNSTFTASLAQGYVWAGGAGNISKLVATSSFGGGGTIDTGSFATTGSNTFIGNQTITTDGNTDVFISSSFPSGQANIKFQAFQSNFQSYGNFQFNNNGQFGGSGSVFFIATSNNLNLASDAGTKIGATNGGGNGIDAGNISMQVRSGSLSLAPSGVSNTTASLLHLSSSSNTANVNLIFKNNSTATSTTISGSNNIFTNPTAAGAGFKRFIGGSGNLMLNPGAITQISASQAFPITTNFNIHTGGSISTRAAVSASAWTINNNMLIGGIQVGNTNANAEKLLGTLTITNNQVGNLLAINANKTAISASTSINSNALIGGATTLTMASSSIGYFTNVGNATITNGFENPGGSSANNSLSVQQNWFGAAIINVSGSDAGGLTNPRTIANNYLFSGYQTLATETIANLSLNGSGSSMVSTMAMGHELGITGSNGVDTNIGGLTPGIGAGSAFFGRWNAQDGNRARTAETVFAVGTGTSTSLTKTGFLIDSGSNTFIEGTLNVSGSTFLSGSLTSYDDVTLATGKLELTGVASYIKANNLTGSWGQTMDINGNALKLDAGLSVSGTVKAWGNGYDFEYGTYSSDFLGGAFNLTADKSLSRLEMGGNQAASIEMFANGGNYDTLKFGVDSGSNGTLFQDLPSGGDYTTWMKVGTSPDTSNLGEITLYRNTNISGNLDVSGSVNFATGSNKQAGTAVLDGANPGAVTVSNSLVTANSIIMVSKQTLANPNGYVAVSAKSSGSFTITSNHNGDADTVGWFIINNS